MKVIYHADTSKRTQIAWEFYKKLDAHLATLLGYEYEAECFDFIPDNYGEIDCVLSILQAITKKLHHSFTIRDLANMHIYVFEYKNPKVEGFAIWLAKDETSCQEKIQNACHDMIKAALPSYIDESMAPMAKTE